MGQSYRIRTELGINKTINVSLEQDFEFLEILSLQIQQTDVYTRSCAEYGVVVGRVTANNGFGIPNARVSVFIPILEEDQSNPIITSIYPYKSPEDKNEDGYRYNLLPYEKSYSVHAATGTLPSRLDVLTDPIAIQVYDKYYKLTAKTNDSGDYMIMGVPIGTRKLVMDVDLSDIGEFSLTPQDLIRMGLATESQVAGNRFRTSNDLNSLPQIITIQKDIDVLPLWGDPTLCQLAITRTDFDLRDDANVDIQPTAVFMGSIYSSPEKFRIRPGCRPKDNLGNLCDLVAGPGQILAIRQTLVQDSDGNPILEEYELEQSGNIIDGDGAWLTELPMNLDYLITNEFGEKVVSYDPSIGIPTSSKYRFKIKWQQPPTLTEQTRRAYYLVPNIKEYGWDSNDDPSFSNPNSNNAKKQLASYYFGLDWTGYTNGFVNTQITDRLNEIIECEDTFYQFKFNKVYTVSGLIDQWKKGTNRGRFIGIKEIDDDSCSSTVNKFPVNDGFRNFDFLFFLFSILLTIIQPTLIILVALVNIVLFFLNIILSILCSLRTIFRFIPSIVCKKNLFVVRLPMITYPNCEACECSQTIKTGPGEGVSVQSGGVLTYLSLSNMYQSVLQNTYNKTPEEALIISESMAGRSDLNSIVNPTIYKTTLSQNIRFEDNTLYHASSRSLPIGERINVFNTRKSYFDGINKVKIKVEPDLNIGSDKYHYDNTIVVLSNTPFISGDILTTVDITKSTDINWKYSAETAFGLVTGISGQSYTDLSETTVEVTYASTPTISNTTTYRLPYGSVETNYKFPSDIEYFQVVTAITWNDINKIWNPNSAQSFPDVLSARTIVNIWRRISGPRYRISTNYFYDGPIDFVDGITDQYILVLQRGVDPYSPKYKQEYKLGKLFGTNEDDPNFTIITETKLNIPIQINSNLATSIQGYNQPEMYHQSYFFKPGIDGNTQVGYQFSGYNTVNTGYYSLLDSNQTLPQYTFKSRNQVLSTISNGYYGVGSSSYDFSEDLSGSDVLGIFNYPTIIGTTHPENYLPYFNCLSYSKTIYEGVSWSALTISDRVKNVLRTDRLPSSDQLDGGSWDNNPALLQQNLNFNFYFISTESTDITSTPVGTGASQPQIDIEGLPNSTEVLESFECENMVSLKCYEGIGDSFGINQNCVEKDSVENGCYILLKNPSLIPLKDINAVSEWAFRYRFFYGLCRGVLSQTFVNNWVNGSLYAFPIQVNTRYNRLNQPSSTYCKDIIYFDTSTTNFYYRSSPFNDNTNRFIGKPTDTIPGALNKRNLLFPTTIMNLGMKDNFYDEITFEPSTSAYVMTELDNTSFGDTSDLVNFFVISRITDESFLARIISLGSNALNQLFSRPERRIDGDLAQLLSINSELGVIKFSPEYYETILGSTNNPVNILNSNSEPIIAVWFSSTTDNLQTKDYLTPGRINFRATPDGPVAPFYYGIKSQVTPLYKWELKNTENIFGTQLNEWATTTTDIVSNRRYQSLDRTDETLPTYFQSTTSPNTNDLNRRGYIFSLDANGNYSQKATNNNKFIVGAPFHFYFGVVRGKSALDKFKTKYSISE